LRPALAGPAPRGRRLAVGRPFPPLGDLPPALRAAGPRRRDRPRAPGPAPLAGADHPVARDRARPLAGRRFAAAAARRRALLQALVDPSPDPGVPPTLPPPDGGWESPEHPPL